MTPGKKDSKKPGMKIEFEEVNERNDSKNDYSITTLLNYYF